MLSLQRGWFRERPAATQLTVSAVLDAGMPASAGQGSSQSHTPAWLIVAIVVPIAVLVTAVAALATLIIRRRQLERRNTAAVDAGLLKVRALFCTA